LAPTNENPASASGKATLGANGSSAADVSTSDSQVTVSLPDGALPPHPPDAAATVNVDPLDPATLGPAPPPWSIGGNAYHVTITYTPSNTAAPALAKPGSLLLRVPSTEDTMLFSADGKTWQTLKTVPSPGNQTVLAPFAATGYYAGALSRTGPPKKHKGPNPIVVGAEIVGALVVVGIVVSLFRRPGTGRRPPQPAKKAPVKKAPVNKRRR